MNDPSEDQVFVAWSEQTRSWASNFLADTLYRWRAASATKTGLFQFNLDREWRPKEQATYTLVSQCRLIYNFTRAFSLLNDPRFRHAAERGLDALERHFRLASGGYCWSARGVGGKADSSLDSYGHAFCILAQATAADVFADKRLAERAMETWHFAKQAFSDTHGGFLWRIGMQSAWEQQSRSQNPLMHMFEALMALAKTDATEEALEEAGKLLSFMRSLEKFRSGALLERHSLDWKPLTGEEAVIDLGHQFEWAFLLSEWYALTGDNAAVWEGAAFLETGLTRGLTEEGGVRNTCDPFGKAGAHANGLWQQCEAVRTIYRYATRLGRKDLFPELRLALDFYQTRFVDTKYGGVFANADAASPKGADKGNAWKLDYHSTNMCLELMGQ